MDKQQDHSQKIDSWLLTNQSNSAPHDFGEQGLFENMVCHNVIAESKYLQLLDQD